MTGLPQGWISSTIEGVSTIKMGKTVLSKDLTPSGLPVYSAGAEDRPWGFLEGHAATCQRGTVVVSARGSIGFPKLPKHSEFISTQTTISVTPSEAVVPEFLLQALRRLDYAELSSGAAIPMLTVGKLGPIQIPLPPLPEQRRIVRKLDTLNARSTTARTHLTTIEKLVERYKRAVAQQLIHAKEWETVPFLDACDAYQPRTISKSELVPDGAYPVYGANGVIGRYDQYNHEDPQLLITCRGATCGTVNVSQPFSWITGNAMVVDGTKSGLSLAFLREYFAKGFDFTTVISGSAQPQITRQSLAQLRMPVVDEDQQREIVRRIETAFAKIDRLKAEAAKALKLLGHLDQRILAKAFAGDLVPQDPTDEPAETLLARIREARAAAPKSRRGRK